MSEVTADRAAEAAEAEAAKPPAATPGPTAPMTEYVILANKPQQGAWLEETARVPARSAQAAVRAHVDRIAAVEEKDGVYIAVPVRSWQPIKVKIETKTNVVLT